MSRCRFCKQDRDAMGVAVVVKYGTRHYAHPRCGFEAKGAREFVALLHDWQVANLPYFVAREFGVDDLVEAAYARQKKGAAAIDGAAELVPGDHSECGPDCAITGDRCDGLHAEAGRP